MGFKSKLHRTLPDVEGLEGTGHTRIACRVYRNADLAVVTGSTETAVPWDAEDVDTHGFHVADATDLIIPSGGDGLYLVVARMLFAGVAVPTGWRRLRLNVGGRNVVDRYVNANTIPANIPFDQAAVALYVLYGGDHVAFNVSHTQGVNLALVGSSVAEATSLSLFYLQAA